MSCLPDRTDVFTITKNCLHYVSVLIVCAFSVPTALRVSGPTNSLGVDVHPSLLSPSHISIGPQGQGYRTADLGDSPGRPPSLQHCLLSIF